MSKFKPNKKATVPVAPVVTAPSIAPASGRTIVDIARELKITPQNARRVARKHADVLGHAGKGARWFLNAEQEQALRVALTAEKPAVAQ
jgi:hypothetical protein